MLLSWKALRSYKTYVVEVLIQIASRFVSSVEQNRRGGWLKLVSVAVKVFPVKTKPPAAIVVRISKDGRHDLGAASPPSTKTSSLQGRSGVLRSVLNLFFSSTAIPTHRLYCCSSGALRAPLSFGFCVPVCHHGKTWLPSAML